MAKVHLLVDGKHLRVVNDGRDPAEAISDLEAKGHKVIKVKPPPFEKLEKWAEDGVARATDGCRVEPDGTCPHGCKSWFLIMGVI